ncbi:MAG: ribosomal protein S18-alanine N-acetyltransferase [Bdellovibrionota bacterium]
MASDISELQLHCIRTSPDSGTNAVTESPIPKLIFFDPTYCEEICALEKRCYSHPWSDELIRGEFQKDVSVRMGLVLPGGSSTAANSDLERGERGAVVAYAFNYIVADELHVLNLAVHPDYRARGFGKYLLSEIIRFGEHRGARYATLEVRQSNSIAKSLYSSLGFEIVGIRKNYYRDNYENALVLELKLKRELLRANG